tara:strand:+ start:660 stop:11768 length:11109 start_codon:yes stop_codon:yes gene_type:complete
MSLISELGPITGINTRSEDLFVIVNLIQGDDGTKNITRKELVQALQLEIFNRITITGGTISNVTMTNSTLNSVEINSSTFSNGVINASTLNDSTIEEATANNVTMTSSVITESEFNDGTGNNVVLTNSTIDDSTIVNSSANNLTITSSDFSDGTGNNNIFTNSQIDNSSFANVAIEGGTANNLILTNITIDELILEDALMSNSAINTTEFSNGSIIDSVISGNTNIFDVFVSNSNIRDTDLDNVNITNSRFSNGQIWDTLISNSSIIDTTANNIIMTSSVINDSSANNMALLNSDFSDGTGNNNIFTNTTVQGTIQDSVIANTSFQGSMSNVVAENLTITSSSASGLDQVKSTFDGGAITDSTIANTTIQGSDLVDFDMELTKVFEPKLDEDSYFALKNVKTGETEKMTYRQLYNEVSKNTEKALKVHVAADGDDRYPGTILQPVRSIKRAAEIALEKAGGQYDRNDIDHAVHISVGPGAYYVEEPIALPDDCSLTSTAGQYATVIRKSPGYERTNGILVGSGCYVQGFGYMNFEVDNFDYPEGGFAIAYRPGALLRRSPYIRDSSQLSNFNRLDVEPALNPFNSKGSISDLGQEFYLAVGHSAQTLFEIDDEVTFSSGATGFISYIADINSNRQIYIRNLKGNVEIGDMLYAQRGGTGTVESIGIDDFPNRAVGRGGGCLLADRAVLDTDSLYTYVLCFGFTPRTQNGTGYVAKNGAGVNGIGSLSIFTRQAFYALNGGQMTLNNSGTQFGDISMRAKGFTTIIRPAEGDDNLFFANTTFADSIMAAKDDILDNMVDFLTANTTTGFEGGPGLGYQGYNADKCFRDTGILVDLTAQDVATGGNYWGRLSGITYSSPISYVVKQEQLTETVGSIEHLKESILDIFSNASSDVTNRISTSLDETINILNNGEENASPIVWTSYTDDVSTSKEDARHLIQDNKDLIIQGMVDWIDNNEDFFAYDSAKCARDIQEYILPAVKNDMMLDTNYNSVTAGNAYYFKQASSVIGNQRNETVAAYERLRAETDKIIQANTALGATRAYDKFNQIVDILGNNGDKFTPTNASYNPATGDFVITMAGHGLSIGRLVTFADEAFTFSCDTDGNVIQLSHPRASDPSYRTAVPITFATTDTITVNTGKTPYTGVHTFVSATRNAVSVVGQAITFSNDANIVSEKIYARQQLQINKSYIQDSMMTWAESNFFMYDSEKCQRDVNEYILPAVSRDLLTGSNFMAIQSGIAYRGKTSEVLLTEQLPQTLGAFEHLKVATTDLVTDLATVGRVEGAFDEFMGIMQTEGKQYTPSDASYDPVSGVFTLTIEDHFFDVGDEVLFAKEGITFSCANSVTGETIFISHPRVTDGPYRVPQTITAKTADTITLNVGNAGGYSGVHTFVRAKAGSVQEVAVLNGTFTPSTATYDPATGITEITIGAHELTVGEQIMIEEGGITFSCDNGGVGEASYPRVTDPAYKTALTISSVSATTITVNVGDGGGYLGVHTFVSALPNGIKTVGVYSGKVTPTDVAYNPVSGEMTLTIGSHSLPEGKWITIAPKSITLSCANTEAGTTVEISHPRLGEPAYKSPVRIVGTTGSTITVNVGNAGGYAAAHTFVSADVDCIDTNAIYWTDPAKKPELIDVTSATYDPSNGAFVVTATNHGLVTGNHVQMKPNSFTFSCDNGGVASASYPRIGDPAYDLPLTVTVSDVNTFSISVGDGNGYVGAHTFVSADADCIAKVTATQDGEYAARQLQANKKFIQDDVDAWIRNNYFVYNKALCQRDTGFILNAVARDVLTGSNVNTVNTGIAYRTGLASAEYVIDEQLTQTVGSLTWLKGEIAGDITNATAISRSNAAFDEIIDIMQNDKAAADTLVFGKTYVTDEAYEAKSTIQANKAFIQDEVTAFIAANYPTLTYDAAKCERDIGYFADTISWDVQHGSNAATVLNSRLYFNAAVGILPADQRTPTAETFEFAANIAGQIVRNEVVTPLQGVTTQVRADNTTFTPTDATYDSVTGVMVITIGTHTYTVGDRISIVENGITFSCPDEFAAPVNISHPRPSDPFFNKPITIDAIDATTITMQVGAAGVNKVHTFVSALADAVQTATLAPTYTPTDGSYDPVGGAFSVTIGTHRLEVGDYIIVDTNGITFSCATSDVNPTPINISHPRASDPWFNKPIEILSVTATTISMNVGDANGYVKPHTFVSATANSFRKASVPAVSATVQSLWEVVADVVRNNDITSLPAITEPAYTTAVANYDAAIDADTQLISGSIPKYQQEITDYIRETYNGLGYDTAMCYRDIGYVVDAITEDVKYGGNAGTINAAGYYWDAALNILPFDQRMPTRLAYLHLADVVEDVIEETQVLPIFGALFTPTDATYDPDTGVFVATIGTHTLTDADHIWFAPESITFSCDNGSGAQNHASPEAHHPFYNKAVPITSVTSTTITLQVGTAGTYSGAHTFVSADADAIKEIKGSITSQDLSGTAGSATIAAQGKALATVIADLVDDTPEIEGLTGSKDDVLKKRRELPTVTGNPIMSPSRTFARETLQRNKTFIQDEIVAFVEDEFYTFDEDKCARDAGFIIDAVRRDVQTGSTYNGKYAGKAYRNGMAGAQEVIEEQLAETIEGIRYIQRDIEAKLSGVALTRATGSFTNIIDVMTNDFVADGTNYNYGTAQVSTFTKNGSDGMIANRAFLQAEATAWVNVNYSSLVYTEAKCQRDTGYMVDAVTYDIRHGTNTAMRDIAKLYFENGLSSLTLAQRAPTVALWTHLATVTRALLLKQPVTPTTGNGLSQSAVFGTVDATTATAAQTLWAIVGDLITDNSLINIPAIVEASGVGTNYSYETEAALIATEKTSLASSITTYLKTKFSYLEYSREKCRRDVGYIVDGISHDVQYGGNAATWNNAQIHFANGVNVLPLSQRAASKRAFMRLSEVVHDVIRQTEVPLRIGRTYTPNTATYDALNGDMVITLSGGHDLKVGNHVMFPTNAFTFSCLDASGAAVNISHPRASDPLNGSPVKVIATTATTITVNAGSAGRGAQKVHTFVSVAKNAVQTVIGATLKQDNTGLVARRYIAREARDLAITIANVVVENNPTTLPIRIEPFKQWMAGETILDSIDTIADNKAVLATAMVNFISKTYNGLSYPEHKCRRDVGIIIDALSHDVQYQTNYGTLLNANMYFDNANSVLPYDQRTQTADFFYEMAQLVQKVVQETAVGQDVSGNPATAVEGAEVANLVRIIEEAIRRNSLDAVPDLVEPDTSWVSADLIWAGNAIDENLDNLADDITTWINKEFSVLDYNKAKCYRDGNYILDAFSYDLNYGGNSASRWNADFYFWNNELRIPEDTRVATAGAYRKLGELAKSAVMGTLEGQFIRNNVGTQVEADQVYDLGLIFYNALFNNSALSLGPLTEPNYVVGASKEFSFAKDILANNRRKLQSEVQRFITSEYKFIDLPKTYRDGGNLLQILSNDFSFNDPANVIEGTDRAMRSFAAALFNINQQHVFPVFNAPASFADWRKLRFKGTVASVSARDAITTKKRWDAYIIPTTGAGNPDNNKYLGTIYHWNGTNWITVGDNNSDLLYSFYKAWEQMKTYINNNIAPDQAHRNMVTELIDNVLIESVLRPDFLVFGSLVESIAHQFNGASAGVNRNALPLNFRNIGAAIGATASVLSEGGGRIRWSGSDELNNQYFARGLKINGRTGRIEGRPFTSSVRKLARRASNSRASL